MSIPAHEIPTGPKGEPIDDTVPASRDVVMRVAKEIEDAVAEGGELDPQWVHDLRATVLAGPRTAEAFDASLAFSPLDPSLNGGHDVG